MLTTVAESIVPLPADLHAQIACITAEQIPGFVAAWMSSMLERSAMVRVADEIDVIRCDTPTFATVLRSAKTYGDLDFMALTGALRGQMIGGYVQTDC